MQTSKFILLFSIISLGLHVSCTADDGLIDDQDTGQEQEVGTPVETNSPNSNFQPAFEGQTRIGSVTTETPFKATVISSDLTAPWGITNLPDGRLLITQKAGQMRIATTSGELSGAITGLPPVNPAGQGGLLGLCVDADFGNNRMVYWVFSEQTSGGNLTAVAKGRLADNESTIENPAVIYRANPADNSNAHYGGRILFDATGNLVVSTGERAWPATRALAQSVSTGLGKIVRITTDGQPAPGNPTFEESGALPELYSYGHRNPQGLAFHPTTGDLWLSEFGPRGGDEVNLITPGANYGWPVITYGIDYNGEIMGGGIQQQEGMEQPVYYWDPVISPSGITFYKGNQVPEWENNLFIGGLSGMHIARLVIDSDNKVVGEERLLVGENQRFRDITQGLDNSLYAITDAGRLYKIDRQ
ncbi:glucose/arabinose dehydrogenase [Algoriphagus iocasae]|uniref:Glucose/arabinose dehydrogenase n=1 Tax=Algoriphagus iocasae TaxID=1836499 RepID=A0A841MWM3_9BACT|nr:PQQ-dependent sugar dehydrogenase [Algoriphagus iocasae]MBB6327008.1 glucose/arabinose dehydrogenase [Algoriphagus iocasae]